MKKLNKKAFTIVELVIVIAVIAILAGVLIPTFVGLIRKSRVSTDTQLVRNLNIALAEDGVNNEHNTMTDVLAVAEDYGYLVTNLNAKAKDNEILWDSANDVFCYLNDGKVEYLPDSVKDGKKLEAGDYRLWKIYNKAPTDGEGYSIYVASQAAADYVASNEVAVGVDCGEYLIDAVSYKNTGAAKNDVVIRTNNYNTVLTVNAPSDVVKHYGKANKVDVIAVACLSYHEHGDVLGNVTLNNGRVVVEEGAKANAVYVDATAEAITAGTVTVSADNSKEPKVPIILRDYVKEAADNKGGNNSIPNPATENVIVLSDKVTETNPETGEVTKTEVTAIAYNKTTKQNYASLAKAVAEANSGDTIIMMNNETTSEPMINITKDITIDGNGYTYTNSNKNSRIIAINGVPDGVYKSYNVTIKNINIVSSYTGSVAINNKEPRGIVAYQLSGAKINISNVKVDMAKDDYTYPVKLLYVENTEVNIENSYLKGANCIECQYINNCEFNIAETTLYSNYTKEKPAYRGNGINFTSTCSNNKITFVDTLFMSDGNSDHFDIDGVYNTVNGELVDIEED